ncbi:MAG: hypothetical protein ABL936_11045 [Aestuariivirga sp.]
MARKPKIETGDIKPLNMTENTELIVHRVVGDQIQRYLTTINLVVTVAALAVTVVGIGSYYWVFNSMVENAVKKVSSELALPKNAIIGMTIIDRDKSGAPTCPQGWRYLSSAEGRFVVGAMPEYAGGQQPVETLILSSSEEIVEASKSQPPVGYRTLESDESHNLAASIGKTRPNALWQTLEKNKQNSQTESGLDNSVPYVAAYFCMKE